MKDYLYSCFSLVLLAALPAVSVSAQVTTDPVGYSTVDVAAGSVSNPVTSIVSLPLKAPVSNIGDSTGTISAVGTNTIANSSAAWPLGSFDGSGNPHYVEITSGNAAGSVFLIQTHTGSQLTLDTEGLDLSQIGIGVGVDSYSIFLGDTLLTVFGTDSDGVIGGTSPSSDVDLVYVQASGAWSSYYYNTSSSQWRKGAVPISQNNLALGPRSVILYSRVGTEPLSLVISGSVPTINFKPAVPPSGVIGYASYFPVDQKLGNLGLEQLSWWRSAGDTGVTSSNADLIYINVSGAWSAYHYNSSVAQWRKGAVPVDQSDVAIIPAGTGFMISRNGGASAVEQANLAMPYSL